MATAAHRKCTMKKLFRMTTVIEVGVGLALLVAPSIVFQLLLGAEISGPGVPVGRLAGTALLSLGAACWLARDDTQSHAAQGLVIAMLFYNVGAAAVLGFAGIEWRTAGIVLWLAVVFHAAMAFWCAALSIKPKRTIAPINK
jgi:hypothetical protein